MSAATRPVPSYDPSTFNWDDPTKLEVATLVYTVGLALPGVDQRKWAKAMAGVYDTLIYEEEWFMADSDDCTGVIATASKVIHTAYQNDPEAIESSSEIYAALGCLETYVRTGATVEVERIVLKNTSHDNDEEDNDGDGNITFTRYVCAPDALQDALLVARAYVATARAGSSRLRSEQQ